MADTTIIIEGLIKYREGKKWKSRWCIVRKLSPVADCLHLQLYKTFKERLKHGPTKASLSLEGFLGEESGFTLDKESNTLAIICKNITVVLALESREMLIEWKVKFHMNLGEEQQFNIEIAHVPPKSHIPLGCGRLHVINGSFCLTGGTPPKIFEQWQLVELRRYGVVNEKFCFEGGSKCGNSEGLHVLISNQADVISSVFELASLGKLSRAGRPVSQNHTAASEECITCTGKCLDLQIPPGVGNSFHSPPIKDHWDSSITICSAESSRPLLKSSDSSTYDVSADAAALSSTTLLPVAGADNELKSASLATDGQNSSYPLIGSLEDNVLMTTLHLNKAHNVPSHPCDIRKSQCYSCGKAFFCDEKCHDGQLTTDSLLLDDNSCNICLRSDNYIHVSTDIAHSPAHTLDSRKHLKGCGRSSGISPKHDCISIKSHGSNSSSGSNSTNSSEYSIPRMHAENLYDRPRSLFPHVCSFVSDEQMMKSNGLILCSSIGNNPPVKHYHSAGAQMITLCNHYLSNFKCCEKCVEKMQLTSVDASKHIPNICQAEQTISSMMCSKHSCISCSSAGALRKVVVSQVAMPHSGQVGSIQKDFQATEYSSASSCPCCATISAQKPQRGLLTNVNNPYHASHLMPETNLPPFWSCSYANYDIPRLAVAPVEEKDDGLRWATLSSPFVHEPWQDSESIACCSGCIYDSATKIEDRFEADQGKPCHLPKHITSHHNCATSHVCPQELRHYQTQLRCPCQLAQIEERIEKCCATGTICQTKTHRNECSVIGEGSPNDESGTTQIRHFSDGNNQYHNSTANSTYELSLENSQMVNAKSHIQLGQQCICSHGTSTAMALSNNVVGSPTKSHCESRNFEQRQKQLMKHAGFTTLPNYANLCRTPSNAFYENASKICERLEEKEKARKSSSECLDHARGCISYARPGDTQESSGLQSDDVVIDRSLTNWLCTPEENLNKLLEPPNSTCVSSISNNLLSDTNVEERQCSKTSGNINFRNVKIDKTASRQASFKHDYANYLLMHPVFAQVSTNDTITDTNLKRQKKEGDPSNSCDLSKHELPLRPFMPLDITKVGHPRCFECGCIPSYKSPNDISVSSSNHHTIRNRPLRRNKSYSMIEVSSKVVVEKRSSSADATRSAFITSEALKGDHFNDDLLPTVADMSLSASRKTWSSAENVINVKNMTSGYTSRTCVDSIMAHVNGNSCSVGELIDETDSLIAARRRQDCTVPYTSNRNSTSSSDSGVSSGSPNKMNTLRENE